MTTEAGERQHVVAWSSYPVGSRDDERDLAEGRHSGDPDDCGACRYLAAIEAEVVAAERARIRAAVERLRVRPKKAGRLAESDYFLGFRASRNETVAAVLAIVNLDSAAATTANTADQPEREAEHE